MIEMVFDWIDGILQIDLGKRMRTEQIRSASLKSRTADLSKFDRPIVADVL